MILICLTATTSQTLEASNLGRAISGAAAFERGYREAQERQLQQELARIQLEQARAQAQMLEIERLNKLQEFERKREEHQKLQRQAANELLRLNAERLKLERDQQNFALYQKALNKYNNNIKLTSNETASLIRPSLPKEISPGVTIFGVSSNPSKLYLSFSYSELDKSSLTDKDINSFFFNEYVVFAHSVCSVDFLESLVKQGHSVIFSVFDKSSRFIDSIDIDNKDCLLYSKR